MRTLRELGVTHVVVHTELYPPGEWEAIEARLAEYPGLRLLRVEGEGRVYAVNP